MSRFIVAAAIAAGVLILAPGAQADPFACFGAGRYDAMRDGRSCNGRHIEGLASFYGSESGPRTASGERFNANAMTAAHRSLPFGTLLRVTHRGASVIVRVNDRGPFVRGRVLDLSSGAARAIGLSRAGVGRVAIEVLR